MKRSVVCCLIFFLFAARYSNSAVSTYYSLNDIPVVASVAAMQAETYEPLALAFYYLQAQEDTYKVAAVHINPSNGKYGAESKSSFQTAS